MTFIIRTDASGKIGTGHFVRCLALAEALIAKNRSVSMVCHSLPENCKKLCEQKGISVHYLPDAESGEEQDALDTLGLLEKLQETVSWVIVDSYKLGLSWQQLIKPHIKKLMVIDDFADSKHECDLLFSQNYPTLNYDKLVPKNTILCLGLKYVLLRPEFYLQRQQLKRRDGKIKRILISFGGADHTHSTLSSLQILLDMKISGIHIDVVTGDLNPDRDVIERLCHSAPNIRHHHQTDKMSKLIAEADLALGSGGSTHWERCFLGLPAIVNIVAENQVRTTEALAAEGRVINIGSNNDSEFYPAILSCLNDEAKLKQMSEKCLDLIPYNPQNPIHVVDHLC